MQVKDFLGSYIKRSEPFFEELSEELKKEAKEMGRLPSEVVERFCQFYGEGKRIRGALMELGYKMSGGKEIQEVVRTSLAMEMIHAGFLVQDDFMDKDVLRRGLPTLYHSIGEILGDVHLGNCMAVCMGDVAFFWSTRIITDSNFGNEEKIAALSEMQKRVIMVGYGQMLDVANSGDNQISEEEVLKVHRYKTAEYTGGLPLVVGSLLAGENDKSVLTAYQEYGMALGWAFQIQDDILGLYGNEDELGKGVGTDLKEARNTLFLTYLRKDGKDDDVNYIEGLIGQELSSEQLLKAQQIFKDSGVYGNVVKMRDEYAGKAMKVVGGMNVEKEDKDTLVNLVKFVVERKK